MESMGNQLAPEVVVFPAAFDMAVTTDDRPGGAADKRHRVDRIALSQNLLQADAIAQLLLEQPPLTPTKLRARLTPRPAQALAEDRPSPHT